MQREESLRAKLLVKQSVQVSRTKLVTFRLASGERLEEFFNPDDLTQVHKCLTFCLPDTVHSFEICEYHSLAGYFYLMHAFLQSNTGSL